MNASAPDVSLCDDGDDFVNDLDLDAVYGGHTCIDLIARLTECHYQFLYCSRYLAGKTYTDAHYGQARELLDVALLHLYRAKWLIGGVTGSFKGVRISADKNADAEEGWCASDQVLAIVADVKAALLGKKRFEDVVAEPPPLSTEGTEVLHAGGFPIVPSICPVVVVQGSSYDMGYQYAEQVLEIYGDFVFREFARLRFTTTRLAVLRRHEAQMARHTPEILDMCRGWADAVTDHGLPMAYENVLHLWCSTDEPPSSKEGVCWPFLGSENLLAAMYFGQQAFINSARASLEKLPAEGQDAVLERCSGFCAWGEATKDGRLKAAATTDHDCWMQATIVAFPNEGNNFIYTPFSVHGGWIPGLGLSTMSGHQGMNNRGLAYVHHGGEVHAMETADTWGYGVPRGACTFHGLRYANSAKDAYEQIMSYPIGNVGSAMGSAGGQWADNENGYAFESRQRTDEHPGGLVREHTFDHDGKGHDLLYTGNSALHADAPSANHGHAEGALDYDIERGWHTYDAAHFAHPNLMVAAGRMTAGPGGAERNKCYFELSIPWSGQIDDSWVERLYCTPAKDTVTAEQQSQRHMDILSGDYRAAASPAHHGNAFTSLTFPDDGDQGLYSGCIGPLKYDLPPNMSTHGYFYYDETNAYWTLRLAESPEALLDDAHTRAEADLATAQDELQKLAGDNPGLPYLNAFASKGSEALQAGKVLAQQVSAAVPQNDRLAALSRALRRFTVAQVRARQVINALHPIAPLPHAKTAEEQAV